jgi:hypothetical protein
MFKLTYTFVVVSTTLLLIYFFAQNQINKTLSYETLIESFVILSIAITLILFKFYKK